MENAKRQTPKRCLPFCMQYTALCGVLCELLRELQNDVTSKEIVREEKDLSDMLKDKRNVLHDFISFKNYFINYSYFPKNFAIASMMDIALNS